MTNEQFEEISTRLRHIDNQTNDTDSNTEYLEEKLNTVIELLEQLVKAGSKG
jgi:hypothetical protein